MGASTDYIDSLPEDAEEVDLSTFEHIEEFDDATWRKIQGRETMSRLKLPSELIKIRTLAFMNARQLTYVTLPSSLRRIWNYAFFSCQGLAMRDLKLPASVEDLGEFAFYGCRRLTGKLTSHITANMSFYNCKGLTALDLANCKVLEKSCFAGCTGLTVLELPSSLQRIENGAFVNCT